jgi:hypothetical protein
MSIKVVTLEATFPELKSGRMYQQGRGRGSTIKAAFAAAGRDLFSQPGLKARRFTVIKMVASVGTEVEVPEEPENDVSPEASSRTKISDTVARRAPSTRSGFVL